ncbi:hypothetical protein DL93DRAFT_644182 [Clavulina sp. PMI_390]|nr:hypothetical protein DL93DRAFT_644182 [Clavulina sp. PMI_390]
MQRNDDICACCSIPHIESNSGPLSHFLYCDGCTRSFHMGCLDPPIVDDRDQPPPDKEWFCPACSAEKSLRGSLPLDPSPFDHLTHLLHGALPKTFALPEDVRGHFKGVGVGRHGVYVNVGEVKPGRANRQGFLEDRDPARIRDRENNLIVCYKCQRTALPRTQLISESSSPVLNENAISSDPSSSTTVSSSHRPERRAKVAADLALQSNRIISCDYCSSHWHLDCLDPPMVHMPSPLKKWMCPNHAEQVMPKRRALKVPKTIEVHRRHVKNNGNIDVIPSAEDAAQDRRYEEVWINAKKYMIPEKTIRLDFLDKVNGVQSPAGPSRIRDRQPTHYRNSSTSSSLTSLPPSDGEDEDSESEESDDDDARQASIATLEELYTKSDAAVALLSLHERVSHYLQCSSNLLC